MFEMKKVVVLLMVLVVISMDLMGQELQRFTLLNEKALPLIGATYSYAGQNAVTGTDGIVSFQYVRGGVMQMSYLGYGSWTLSDDRLQKIVSIGEYVRMPLEQNLQPVTVIAVRPKVTEREDHHLGFNEKMAHDAGDILSQKPVLSGIRKSGSYGTDPVMRGFKYDQLNIVMNGTQSATAACPNRMDPPTSQMAPNMIQRIEILKGPYALRFGGGLGGTINFITEPALYTAQSALSGRWSGRYEENGGSYRSEGMLSWSGQHHNIALLGSLASGNDYRDGNDRKIQGDYTRNSLGTNMAYRVGENQSFRISAFHNWAKDVDFPSLMMDLRKDQTTMVNATHEATFLNRNLESWKTTVFLSAVDHRMDNLLKPLDPRMMDAGTDAKTNNIGGRSEGTWQFDNHRLYAGFDIKRERAKGVRTREVVMGPMTGKVFKDNAWQHGQIIRAGTFAEYHIRQGGWNMVGSFRLELNQSDLLDADQTFSDQYGDVSSTQVLPSVSFGAIRNLGQNLALGFWGARAMRSAGLTERYINRFPVGVDPYELIGNPDLKPEVNHQMDITLEWKNTKASINLDFFGVFLEDYITSLIVDDIQPLMPNRPGVRRFINIDQAFKTGFEVDADFDMNHWFSHTLDIAYTYGQDLASHEPLPEIAPLDLRYGISLQDKSGRFTGRAELRYVSSQNRVSTEFGESSSPGFTTLNIEGSYGLASNWKLQAGVQNLTNVSYAEHLSRSTLGTQAGLLNARGRNLYISTSIQF